MLAALAVRHVIGVHRAKLCLHLMPRVVAHHDWGMVSVLSAEHNRRSERSFSEPLNAGNANLMKVLERALRLAQLDGNVLLTGETGVGKNMLARYIHIMSRRAQGPFIHVNCAESILSEVAGFGMIRPMGFTRCALSLVDLLVPPFFPFPVSCSLSPC